MQEITERMNRKKGVCLNVHCRNKVNGSRNDQYCSTCRCRLSRLRDPIRYAFNNIKSRAKRTRSVKWPNGIPFTITLPYFRKFCYRTKYIKNKSRSMDGLSCDRVREDEGYIEGNIQAIPLLDNIQKYHRKKKCAYDWLSDTAKAVELPEFVPTEDDF